jgi:hypothetical protein
MAVIGIDLGTSNSAAAVLRGGRPVMIPSAEGVSLGGKAFPSYVALTPDGQLLVDVTPLTLGVETLGGIATALVGRNTPIPVKRTETFTTAADMQTAVTIHVFQGERPMARTTRASRVQPRRTPPAPRGVPKIEVTFDIDANGILDVSARDTATAKSQSIRITGSTRLPENEKRRMIAEAERFAEQDRKRREDAEMLNAADAVLLPGGEDDGRLRRQAQAELRTRIEASMRETREAPAERDVARAVERGGAQGRAAGGGSRTLRPDRHARSAAASGRRRRHRRGTAERVGAGPRGGRRVPRASAGLEAPGSAPSMAEAQRDTTRCFGVARDAEAKTIKDAFRRLALQYHPDRNRESGAEERFKEIAEAYAVLSDPKRRADYDAGGFAGVAGFTPEDLFARMDLRDLYGGLGFDLGGAAPFARWFGHRPPGEPRGANVEVELVVPLERVLRGGEETVRVPHAEACGACRGSGAKAGTSPRRCEPCAGTGQHVVARRKGGVAVQTITT